MGEKWAEKAISRLFRGWLFPRGFNARSGATWSETGKASGLGMSGESVEQRQRRARWVRRRCAACDRGRPWGPGSRTGRAAGSAVARRVTPQWRQGPGAGWRSRLLGKGLALVCAVVIMGRRSWSGFLCFISEQFRAGPAGFVPSAVEAEFGVGVVQSGLAVHFPVQVVGDDTAAAFRSRRAGIQFPFGWGGRSPC